MNEHCEQVKRDIESWDQVLRLSAGSHSIYYVREELHDSGNEHWREKKFVVYVTSMMQFQ